MYQNLQTVRIHAIEWMMWINLTHLDIIELTMTFFN